MYLFDGAIVMVVSDGGVVIFLEGFGQLHRVWKRAQLMHAPRVSSVISLLTVVVRKGLPIPAIIMKTIRNLLAVFQTNLIITNHPYGPSLASNVHTKWSPNIQLNMPSTGF